MSHYIYMSLYKQRIPMKNHQHSSHDNGAHEGGPGQHRCAHHGEHDTMPAHGRHRHGGHERGEHRHGGHHRGMKMARLSQRAYERGFQAGFEAALSRMDA